jgi:PAS domain S-box-containing protein
VAARSNARVSKSVEDAVFTTQEQQILRLRAELAAERAARQQMQQELNLRNAALDAATTHFMILDALHPEQPILYVNRALAATHGYSGPEALIGKSVSVLLDASDAQQREEMCRALRESDEARLEVEFRRRDGGRFLAGFTRTPLYDERGVITHYVILGADITEKRDSELKLRVAQKLESVGRLAAGLAHEINTPVQYISDSVFFLRIAFDDLDALSAAYRAAVTSLPPTMQTQEALARIEQLEAASDLEFLKQEVPKAFERTLDGAARVAGIVRAMKEFAYPDAVEHTPADINHALQTTLTVARGEYKYAAAVATAFSELPPVTCNVGELNQVFLNLIVNAAHAIHDSGKDASTGCIRVSTRVEGGLAEIEIADNGCGIDARNLEKIFDPFFTTKEVGRGTGQGLAIARSIIVDKHAGRIDVHSTPGLGTRFVVRLPVQGRKAVAEAA